VSQGLNGVRVVAPVVRQTLADFEIDDMPPSSHCSVITPSHVSIYRPVPRNAGSPLAHASESPAGESRTTSTTRRTEASASAAKIRPARQALLDRRSSILVRMATIPPCGHARNGGALARGRIPFGVVSALRCREDFGNLGWINRRRHVAIDDLKFSRPVDWL